MINKTPQKQKNSAVFTVITVGILTVMLSGCGQVASGTWYDSDRKAQSKKSQSTAASKPAENPADGKGSSSSERQGGGLFASLRNKLDRRTAAEKQHDEARRAKIYGTQTKPASQNKPTKSAKSQSAQAAKNAAGLVTVQKGETYYSLARRYKVPVRALLAANKARPPYVLSPGDRISVPQQAFYAVRRQDTLYSISRANKTDVATLAKLNGLKKPYTISVGQRLQIPGQVGGKAPSTSVSTAASGANKVAAKNANRSLPQAPKRVGRFRVPLQGTVISSFGPKEGGLHNDGINIAARSGAPIVAAENGVVVYTGNELRGYGNLLLIRHSGGWVSAYAHTSKFRVKPGQKVKQGDIVAEVGQTGNVDRPQLHFELRKGTRAVNPQSLI